MVVYKIDRLTRSLFDFAKIVEMFDAHKVSFVSVTQAFNTTTSMGRLTLNVLLSFAQFEREVTGERIRDKFAASKKKGMWMGGNVPLGYDIKDRKLVINKSEAETVRTIFRLYVELGAVSKVKAEIDRLKLRTKIQTPKSTVTKAACRSGSDTSTRSCAIAFIAGRSSTRARSMRAIMSRSSSKTLWDKAQARLAPTPRCVDPANRPKIRACWRASLRWAGNRMTPSHAVKSGKRYRYYISNNLIAGAESRPKG